MEKREPSDIVGGNVNWYSHYREQYRFPKKTKKKLPYDLVILLLGMQKKTLIQKDTCIPLIKIVLLTVAETRKQSKCPSTDE